MGVQEYFGQDEKLAGVAAGERLKKDGAKKVHLRHSGAGPRCDSNPAAPASRSASRGSPRSSTSTARTCRRWNRRSPPSFSRIQVRRPRRRAGRADCVGRRAIGRQRRQLRQGGHLRHQRRARRRDQGRRRASGRWTSSRSCRAIWRSTRCGCIINNKNLIGGGQATLTGPSFIDETNIDAVAELAKSGTR